VGVGQYPLSKLSARSMDCLTCCRFLTVFSRQSRAPTEVVFFTVPLPRPLPTSLSGSINPDHCSPATPSTPPPSPPSHSPARASSGVTRCFEFHNTSSHLPRCCQFKPTKGSVTHHLVNRGCRIHPTKSSVTSHRVNCDWRTHVHVRRV
jgi:hypothetical protein